MPQTVTVESASYETRQKAEQDVFKNNLSERDYGDLAGDILGDSHIRVWYDQYWASKDLTVRFKILMENCLGRVTVRINPDMFELSEVMVFENKRGRGLSGVILYKIAETAKAWGFSRLQGIGEKGVHPATKEPISWGFNVFPKLGFNAPVPPQTPERPENLAGFDNLLDLIQAEGDSAWWRKNGVQIPEMIFELGEGSRSWQVLRSRV